jgi:hypothetical protein
MYRVTAVGLLGLMLAPMARAQYPGCAADGGYGAGGYSWGYGCKAHGYDYLGKTISNPLHGCSHNGCGGFCFRLFPGFHQEGPLFNYGPYMGYYPFQPYGPWTSDLRYTGPLGGSGAAYGHCCSWGSHLNALSGKLHSLMGGHRACHGGECSTCGGYARATWHNVGYRVNPFGHGHHKKSGCSDCGGSITTDAVADSALPIAPEHVTRNTEAVSEPILQAGYPRRER